MMGASTDSRPLMATLLVISLVIIVLNSVLFAIGIARKDTFSKKSHPCETAAIVIGIVMTLVWTVALWPIMTGSSKGAYVVYVNGVASNGGLVDIMPGFVPIFVGAIMLITLPLAIGHGINKLRESGRSNAAGKRSTPALVFSIIGVLVGLALLRTAITLAITRPDGIEVPGIVSVVVIGLIPLALGIRGIVRYARAK